MFKNICTNANGDAVAPKVGYFVGVWFVGVWMTKLIVYHQVTDIMWVATLCYLCGPRMLEHFVDNWKKV